jgi:hypothetical protein
MSALSSTFGYNKCSWILSRFSAYNYCIKHSQIKQCLSYLVHMLLVKFNKVFLGNQPYQIAWDQTFWCSGSHSCFIFGKSWVKISAQRPAILTGGFSWFYCSILVSFCSYSSTSSLSFESFQTTMTLPDIKVISVFPKEYKST